MKDTNLVEDLRLLSPPDLRWVPVAVAFLLLAVLGAWIRSRRPAAAPPLPPAGPGPWETALAALEGLVGLLHADASRDYGIAATTILRRYVEQRFNLDAPRLATEEFLTSAALSPALTAGQREHLGRFLELGDLFKFGRFTASTAELTRLHEAAVKFVLTSRPEPPPPAQAPGGAP